MQLLQLVQLYCCVQCYSYMPFSSRMWRLLDKHFDPAGADPEKNVALKSLQRFDATLKNKERNMKTFLYWMSTKN